MTYPHVNAAFINNLAEEGTKDEAIHFLQEQWNETCYLRGQLKVMEDQIVKFEKIVEAHTKWEEL